MSTMPHRHGTTSVAFRFAQPNRCAPTNTETACPPVNKGTRPDRPRRAKENQLNNLNSILLEGNLTRDPELRYTPKNTPVCTLVVASQRTYKVDGERVEEVSLIETTTWGKLATVCAEHLQKGRGIRVVGRIKQERWEDPDGNSRSKVVIAAEHIEFQPRRAVPAPQTDVECIAS